MVTVRKLFKISGKTTINVRNYRIMCIEIFKTLNIINSNFVKEIFRLQITNRPIREKYKLNLEIPKTNQIRFGTKSLRYLGPKVWNSFPFHIKWSRNFSNFKTLVKSWNGTTCKIYQIQSYTVLILHLLISNLIVQMLIYISIF